jgi:hypothetical protein
MIQNSSEDMFHNPEFTLKAPIERLKGCFTKAPLTIAPSLEIQWSRYDRSATGTV